MAPSAEAPIHPMVLFQWNPTPKSTATKVTAPKIKGVALLI